MKLLLFLLTLTAYSTAWAECRRGNCVDGYGTYYYTGKFRGDRYEGEHRSRKKEGQGSYYYANGNRYVGEFRNGRINGQGTLYLADGSRYEGEYRNGIREGQGTYYYGSGEYQGDRHEGEYRNDKPNGQGTYYFLADHHGVNQGDRHEGEYRNGKPEGPGTYYYANGNRYVGEFRGWRKHGQGTLFKVDGTKQEGMWGNGKFLYARKDPAPRTIAKREKKDPAPTTTEKRETGQDQIISASSGTGFAVSDDGYVITNHHVINGCQEVVLYSRGIPVPLTVVTYDGTNDLALSQRRAFSYFAGSTLAATGLPSEEEVSLLAPFRDQIPERVFTEPYALPVSTGHGMNRAVLDRSRQLLADAGWVINDGRLQNKQGQPFTLEIVTQHLWARRLLLPYIQSLGVLGIDARLRLLEMVQAVRVKQQRQFDLFFNDISFANPPMASLQYYFSSEYAEPGTAANLGGIRDPVVDFLIERAQRTPDIDTASIACRALDRILLWGFYHIPLNMPEEERFLYWDKFGRPDDTDAIYEYLTDGLARVIDTWWFDDVRVRSQ
jgi:hypothetical protein